MDGAQINLGAYVFAGQRARCPRYSESVTSANPTREIDFYFSSEQIYRTVGTHHFHPPRLCEIVITIYHPLRPEGRRFPRHRTAGLGCVRFVVARCGRLLAVPTSRYSYPGMGFRGTSYCSHPHSGTEEGVSRLKSGNPDTVRLIGRVDRLG